MAETAKCPNCGVEVRADAPFGHCSKCLFELGFAPVPEDASTSVALPGGKARCFGDYELLGQIGRGGMGVVYKARHVKLNRTVALKMILAGESASPMLLHRFQIEAEAAATLAHPNIVPIYDIGEHEGLPYFSMQLIEGTRLDGFITPSGFRSKETKARTKSSEHDTQMAIARLISTVARAIDHAHKRGVLHRDLKPSNILLDVQGRPYLTDFGLAKMADREQKITITGSILGTPSYMAPEQAAGSRGQVTVAADIYSLGAILYEMLTGRPPFRANTTIETLRQVVESEPRHPQTLNLFLDRDLATICLKCLEKDPLRRYASAEALADDLDRWQRQERIRARPASPYLRTKRWTRKNPAVATLLVVLSLALAGTLVFLQIVKEKEEAKSKALQEVKALEQEREKNIGLMKNELGKYRDYVYGQQVDSVLISSEKRAALMGEPTGTAPAGMENRFKFGIYVHVPTPWAWLNTFAPILNYLETSVSEKLQRPVRIDFIIFRNYQVAMAALLSGEVDFVRFGAASYVLAKYTNSNVSILAAQRHKNFNGVIFTQATNRLLQILQDLKGKGKSLAFGNANSTTGSQLARFYLADNGFRADDFSNFATNYLNNHADVTNAIAHGKFDAGAAKESFVRPNPNLRILGKYPNIGMIWVAGPRFDLKAHQAIRLCLLTVDSKLLEHFEDDVEAFEEKADSDYDALRTKMEKAKGFYPVND